MNTEREIVRLLKKGIKRMDAILMSEIYSEAAEKELECEQRIANNEAMLRKFIADYKRNKD